MLQRIHHAAKAVCDEQWADSTEAVLLARSCVADATSRAVAKLDSPLVTALYSGKPATSALAMATKP
jgi:UrcA family protein